MEKRKNSFMNNVAAILGSQFLIKILGLVYNLVIINIPGFGDIGNGYRTAGFQFYTMLLAISSVGIPNAISKMVSEKLALDDREGAERVFRTAFSLFAGIGLAASLLLYWGADFIALTVVKMDGVQLTLRALSPSIFFVCVSAVIRGYFLGQHNVAPNNRSQLLEQVFKATLTILFVYLLTDFTAAIMAAGANAASTVSTALSFAYLAVVLVLYRRKNGVPTAAKLAKGDRSRIAKQILSLSIPISLSSIITTVSRVIDTATISRGIQAAFATGIPGISGIPTVEQLQAYAATMNGMLTKADNITNLPLALNIAFATVLVPTISAALVKGERETASQKISYSILVSTIIILPCAAGLIVLAQPFFDLLYPNASLGAGLLQWAAVALIFTALDQTICGSLQGLGRVRVPATGLLLGAIVKFILNMILIRIPSVNIYGAVISSVACHLVAFLYCFHALKKAIPLRLKRTKYFTKPILCTLIMSVVTWGSYKLVMLLCHVNLIAVVVSVGLSVVVYFAAVFGLHVLNREEVLELPMGGRIVRLLKL
ncbi:MAG: polysaccharide biosynthesis protein [Clostridia bacterium]|nr:polysaccharide biosynthesis protein [Clostridia bacterium]